MRLFTTMKHVQCSKRDYTHLWGAGAVHPLRPELEMTGNIVALLANNYA